MTKTCNLLDSPCLCLVSVACVSKTTILDQWCLLCHKALSHHAGGQTKWWESEWANVAAMPAVSFTLLCSVNI